MDNSNQKQLHRVPRHCEERSDVAIFMTVWLHPSEILGFVRDPVTKYMISSFLVLRALTFRGMLTLFCWTMANQGRCFTRFSHGLCFNPCSSGLWRITIIKNGLMLYVYEF